MDPNCIFCKIVSGEIPSERVYEDEEIIAFMDIGPIISGHTLVIPRKHIDPITVAPPQLLNDLIRIVQRIAGAQMNGLKADGVNIMQNNGKAAGQEVPHLHFHVIPRFKNDGHHWNWNPKTYKDAEECAYFAEQIRSHL
jgi:histidine triad (HIT) family protein